MKRIARYFILALFFPLLTFAAKLSISPVRVEFSGQRPYGIIQITNTGNDPVTLQARVFQWGFVGEKENLHSTDDVILNPPLVKLAPKAQQSIRVGLRKPNAGTSELSYRLILEELPANTAESGMVIRTLLRISIPLFASPQEKAAPKLQWSIARIPDGTLWLKAVNTGTAHVQVRTLKVSDAQDLARQLTSKIPVYLLPTQGHEWPLDGFDKVSEVRVEALTDAGNEQTVVKSEIK